MTAAEPAVQAQTVDLAALRRAEYLAADVATLRSALADLLAAHDRGTGPHRLAATDRARDALAKVPANGGAR